MRARGSTKHPRTWHAKSRPPENCRWRAEPAARAGSVLHLRRADRLDADLLGELGLVAREIRAGLHRVVARVRQVDFQLVLDMAPARPPHPGAPRPQNFFLD